MRVDDLTLASDAQLVVGIARWRQDALAEAYRRHAGAVFALASRVLGSRNLAEEVVQEIFLRLWNDADRFDPDRGTLRSWLLHHGRRDAVAAELFVHPQTVRYRMGQLREVFGDRLEDPRHVLELTIALGLPTAPPQQAGAQEEE